MSADSQNIFEIKYNTEKLITINSIFKEIISQNHDDNIDLSRKDMSFGVFKLSLHQRRTLGLIFNILNFLQILLGLSVTVTSAYIVLYFAPILYSERSEINFVFIVTGIYGTHVILHYLMGIKICEKCLTQPQKYSLK